MGHLNVQSLLSNFQCIIFASVQNSDLKQSINILNHCLQSKTEAFILGLCYLHMKNGAEDWRLAAAINLYPAAEGVLVILREQ